jgi:hypothetical protein
VTPLRKTGRKASEGVPGAFSIAAETSVTPSCSSVTRKSSTSRRLSLSPSDRVLCASLTMFNADICDVQVDGWDVVASRVACWAARRVCGAGVGALVGGADRAWGAGVLTPHTYANPSEKKDARKRAGARRELFAAGGSVHREVECARAVERAVAAGCALGTRHSRLDESAGLGHSVRALQAADRRRDVPQAGLRIGA